MDTGVIAALIENFVLEKDNVIGSYASGERAKNLIDWGAKYSIEDGIRDASRWDDIRETILNYN